MRITKNIMYSITKHEMEGKSSVNCFTEAISKVVTSLPFFKKKKSHYIMNIQIHSKESKTKLKKKQLSTFIELYLFA